MGVLLEDVAQQVRLLRGGGDGGALLARNNLSDLLDPAVARSNLGLGTAALSSVGDFLSSTKQYAEVFKVDAYGAVGDGTADDVTAIQAAIAAAIAAGGGVVWFTPGKTYAVSTTLTLNSPHISLGGATAFSAHLKPISGGVGFANGVVMITANDCTVRNLGFQPASSTFTANPAADAIRVEGANGGASVANTRIENCTGFYNNGYFINVRPYQGVKTNVPPNITYITNCYCQGGAGGLHLQGGGSTFSIGAQVVSCYFGAEQDYGYFLEDAHDVEMSTCQGGSKAIGKAGLHLYGNTAACYFSSCAIGCNLQSGSAALRIVKDIPSGDTPYNLNFGQCIFEAGENGAYISAGDGINFVNCNFTLNTGSGFVVAGGNTISVLNCGWNGNNTPKAWISGHAYLAGDRVLSVSIPYVALSNVTSATAPASDPTNWAVATGYDVDVQTATQVWLTLCNFLNPTGGGTSLVTAATKFVAGNTVRMIGCSNNTGTTFFGGDPPKHRIMGLGTGSTEPYIANFPDLPPDDFFSVSADATLARGLTSVSASGAARAMTLPTAVGIKGQEFVIIKNDATANTVTVARTSSQTINGVAADVVLANQFDFVVLRSNGANWLTLGSTAVSVAGALIGSTTNTVTAPTTLNAYGAATANAALRIQSAAGTSGSPTALLSGSQLGKLSFGGYTSGGFTSALAAVRAVATENFSATAGGTNLSFWTTPNTTLVPAVALTLGQDQSATFAGIVTLNADPLLPLQAATKQYVDGLTGGGGLVNSAANTVTAETSLVDFGGVATFGLESAQGTSGSPTKLLSGNALGAITFGGQYDSTVGHRWPYLANITAYALENFDATHGGTSLQINTTPLGSTSNAPVAVFDSYGQKLTATFTQTAAATGHLGTELLIIANQTYNDGAHAPFWGGPPPPAHVQLQGTFTYLVDAIQLQGVQPAFQHGLAYANDASVAAKVAIGTGFLDAPIALAYSQNISMPAVNSSLNHPGQLAGPWQISFYASPSWAAGAAATFSNIQSAGLSLNVFPARGTHMLRRYGLVVEDIGSQYPVALTTTTTVVTNIVTSTPGTFTVKSTAGFTSPAASFAVRTSTGVGVIAYTGTTSTTFTGCTYSAGTGNIASGASVSNGSLVDEQVGLIIGALAADGIGVGPLQGAASNVGIRIGANIAAFPNDCTFTASAMAGNAFVDFPANYTFDYATGFTTAFTAYGFSGKLLFNQLAFASLTVVSAHPIIKNVSTVAANLGFFYGFDISPIFQADAATITGGASFDLVSNPTYNTTGGGTLTASAHTALRSTMVVGSGATVTTRYGFNYVDKTGAGTLTTQYGILIPALSGATTNVGISNAASLVQSGAATFSGAVTLSGGVTGFVSTYTVAPATQTASYDLFDIANGTAIATSTNANILGIGVNLAPTITYGIAAGASVVAWEGFASQPTHQNSGAARLASQYIDFYSSPTFKTNDNTNPQTVTTADGFRSLPLLVAGGSTGTLTVTTLRSFSASQITVPANVTVTTFNQLQLSGPVATGTITTRRGINITDGSGAGTFTTQIGLDIAALAAAGTNIGIRNAATTVFTPDTVQALVAATQIVPDATVIHVTSTAVITLTATPTIAAGQDGQMLVITNDNTTASRNITFQSNDTLAGSNLSLSATTLAIGPRGQLTLVYSVALTRWVQIGANTGGH